MPFLLIDCDAFFASCEQARNPRLRGKKVMVAGDPEHRSVITAASYEAKNCGARAGMPVQRARALVPDGIFIRGDHALYLDFNVKLLNKLETYRHPVEVYSVDEFFVDFRGSYAGAEGMAREFKDWVRTALGITVSVGIASTKIYAKLACELGKPDGLTVLLPGETPAGIKDLPAGRLFGVGPRTEEFLQRRGIQTIGDLLACPAGLLEAWLGVRGAWLRAAAAGCDGWAVKVAPDPYKSLGNEMTLPRDTADPEEVHAFLLFLADTVARRLRADGSMGRTIHLRVRYGDWTGFLRSRTMPRPVYLAEQILAGAAGLFARHHRDPGKEIRLLGLGVSNLVRPRGRQLPLPLFGGEERAMALARALDGIKERFGQDAIGRASTMRVRRGFGPFAVVPGSGRGPGEGGAV